MTSIAGAAREGTRVAVAAPLSSRPAPVAGDRRALAHLVPLLLALALAALVVGALLGGAGLVLSAAGLVTTLAVFAAHAVRSSRADRAAEQALARRRGTGEAVAASR